MTALPEHDDDLVAASPGDRADWQALNGSLLLLRPTSYETGIMTTASTEPKDAVRADLVVLDGPQAGADLRDVLVFPNVMVGTLKRNIGKKVVGRLGQGAKQPGKNAPWQLNEPTDQDMAKARAFLANRGRAAAPAATSSAATPPF